MNKIASFLFLVFVALSAMHVPAKALTDTEIKVLAGLGIAVNYGTQVQNYNNYVNTQQPLVNPYNVPYQSTWPFQNGGVSITPSGLQPTWAVKAQQTYIQNRLGLRDPQYQPAIPYQGQPLLPWKP